MMPMPFPLCKNWETFLKNRNKLDNTFALVCLLPHLLGEAIFVGTSFICSLLLWCNEILRVQRLYTTSSNKKTIEYQVSGVEQHFVICYYYNNAIGEKNEKKIKR